MMIKIGSDRCTNIKIYRATYINVDTDITFTKDLIVSDDYNILDAKRMFYNETKATAKIPNKFGFIQLSVSLVDQKSHIFLDKVNI